MSIAQPMQAQPLRVRIRTEVCRGLQLIAMNSSEHNVIYSNTSARRDLERFGLDLQRATFLAMVHFHHARGSCAGVTSSGG